MTYQLCPLWCHHASVISVIKHIQQWHRTHLVKAYLKNTYEKFDSNFKKCHCLSVLLTINHHLYWLGKEQEVVFVSLTHWGRVTHICVGNLTIIGSDNGLSPGRRQAITWTNVGILLIRPLGTNFSEILIGIQTFSFKKMHLKMSSAKWRPFVSASMC